MKSNEAHLYTVLAACIAARANSQEHQNTEWFTKWTDMIERLAQEFLPHGSGFDRGCTIDLTKSTHEKIVIDVPIHYMDEHGSYAGWFDFAVIVKPSLLYEIDIRVVGRSYNERNRYQYGWKEHIAECMTEALRQVVDRFDPLQDRVKQHQNRFSLYAVGSNFSKCSSEHATLDDALNAAKRLLTAWRIVNANGDVMAQGIAPQDTMPVVS